MSHSINSRFALALLGWLLTAPAFAQQPGAPIGRGPAGSGSGGGGGSGVTSVCTNGQATGGCITSTGTISTVWLTSPNSPTGSSTYTIQGGTGAGSDAYDSLLLASGFTGGVALPAATGTGFGAGCPATPANCPYWQINNQTGGTITMTVTTSTLDGASSVAIPTGKQIAFYSDGTNYHYISSAASGGGITALTGDVTASGSGSVAATVAKIAGVAVGTPSGTTNVAFTNGPTFVTPTLGVASGTALSLGGSQTASAWTTAGIRFNGTAASYTDSSSSGTVAAAYTDLFPASTILASSATTYTDYYGTYFKAPIASTNVTMTNKAALGADSILIPTPATTGSTVYYGMQKPGNSLNGMGTNTNGNNGIDFITGTTAWVDINASHLTIGNAAGAQFGITTSDPSNTNPDTILSRGAAATWQFGAANAASPVNQTLQAQGVVVGTTSNGTGGNLLIQPGVSTGNATTSQLNFDTWVPVSTGSATQTQTLTLQLAGGAVSMPSLAASSAATTGTVCWTTGGNLTVDTTLACLASLEELKDIHGPIKNALSKVSQLEPFSFTWKDGTPQRAGDTQEQFGLGAHQVAAVDKRLVSYSDTGKLLGVRYQEMAAVLVQAIKEQQAEIEELKDKVR